MWNLRWIQDHTVCLIDLLQGLLSASTSELAQRFNVSRTTARAELLSLDRWTSATSDTTMGAGGSRASSTHPTPQSRPYRPAPPTRPARVTIESRLAWRSTILRLASPDDMATLRSHDLGIIDGVWRNVDRPQHFASAIC